MNCDRIARFYRWLEYAGFGKGLERRRFRFLREVSGARRALVLGDGDGRFLARLLAADPELTADYVDLSAGMLALARARARDSRAVYRRGDARELTFPDREYDLIATHFFFDCFEEADARLLAARISAAARPQARWLVSEFRRTWWSAPVLLCLYLFFRWTTGLKTSRLIDHRPLLSQQGFHLEREEVSSFGLLASELWSRP